MRKAPGRRAGRRAGAGLRGRAVSGSAPVPHRGFGTGNILAQSHGRGKVCCAKRDPDIFDRLSSPVMRLRWCISSASLSRHLAFRHNIMLPGCPAQYFDSAQPAQSDWPRISEMLLRRGEQLKYLRCYRIANRLWQMRASAHFLPQLAASLCL